MNKHMFHAVGAEIHTEAELTMCFEEEHVAEILMRALAPDNEPLPSGLDIEVLRRGKTVIFKIFCYRSVKSLLATLDDILSMSVLVLKCLRAVNR